MKPVIGKINRVICFGDSYTEGEGSNLELTSQIVKLYKDQPAEGRKIIHSINNKGSWPYFLSKLTNSYMQNEGQYAANNNDIFNKVFEVDKWTKFGPRDIVVVMWSSSIRDKLPYIAKEFAENGPVGLGWSLSELSTEETETQFVKRYYLEDINKEKKQYLESTLVPFYKEYFKKFMTTLYTNDYYDNINLNYVYQLQEYFKFKKTNYLFIDGFENMNSFSEKNSKKWDIIDKDHYWNFGKETAWSSLNELKEDVFEDPKLTHNMTNAKLHPNMEGYRIIGKQIFNHFADSILKPSAI